MSSLVSPLSLAARLDDPSVAILDASLPPIGVQPPIDTRSRYLEQHIPGAVFFDIEELSDPTTTLPHMLPSPDAFSSAMSALGIGDNMSIVIYEQSGVFSAPRAWWMLRVFGAKNVSVLDGGLTAWITAGLPTQSGKVRRPPATFNANLNHDAVKNFTQIQQAIAHRAQILDARSAGRFSGSTPEPRPHLASGHMPGATNIPYSELVEDGRFKQPIALRDLFAAKIDIDQPVITTCGSGITAAVLALGLEIAGAKQVSLYDGSWTEYAQHSEAIIER